MTPVSPETMARELLPCPFCSSPRVRVYSSDWCYAECRECFARAARFGTKKKAIEAWNRRAGYSAALAAPLTEDVVDELAKADYAETYFPAGVIWDNEPDERKEWHRKRARAVVDRLVQLRTGRSEGTP
jgi:hypothetical protein